ncbi:hypothetical protein [Streptomyces pinistramenti]|uniref:hypothetical protein n=1 Tax=Streptomyces pinistramenti TaxID=2884812 RepID=UPI001D0729D9|nr:hypothetical protein [Streptomyces pinistramenti]MCB5908882.1 hypothetical protein [Streptomyces pinistramenti]
MKMCERGRTAGVDIRVGPCRPGTTMSGQAGNTGRDGCVRTIRRAPEAGIDFAGTADAHSGGEPDEAGGGARSGRSGGLVTAAKAGGAMRSSPNCAGSWRRWIVTGLGPLGVPFAPPPLTCPARLRRPSDEGAAS